MDGRKTLEESERESEKRERERRRERERERERETEREELESERKKPKERNLLYDIAEDGDIFSWSGHLPYKISHQTKFRVPQFLGHKMGH